MPNRIARAANRNPFLTSLMFSALVFASGLTAFKIQSQRTIDRVAAEATERREELAVALAASQLDVCRRAVTAVTDQLNADLLKVVKTVEDRFAEQGKPVPAVYLQLELVLTNRRPPVAACVPKENP